ncbi:MULTISPECIES: ABC transporter substrate-binding protein [unclassified Rhodococcus (in: high G+C Gram-positive bacteria)]|uniref:substrate-binding periplasmic protein n=1 Tax=unclassified Rhodococcus (in: high G+C Gram-positive bacteria) TaxID=192944 RepID=UPI001639FAB4|nr:MULTISPECIES: ABC transporter substrate-binding protein [unclassified Rhodococcus (in: high G+C Gram-positive bacteria)]MBC2637828.1 amino acid ABC transporter substrate-binding protein [Rhodococcus sp. 3A]MBC2897425.1 amino acid ABC transporter substrate-binding protein [Rhodococcus sp. 4CII]
MSDLELIQTGTLVLCSTDIAAPPMTSVVDGVRFGYEPDLGRALAKHLGLELQWVDVRRWADFVPTLTELRCDAILCNQAITPAREEVVDFTIPYGRFNEGVVVRTDSPITSAADLVGRKVGAIAGTTNIALAASFAGAEVIEFGSSDDAFHEMADAAVDGTIDAFVDDEIVLPALEATGTLRVAFIAPTGNPYGIAVRKDSTALRTALNGAIQHLIADGTLLEIWHDNFPDKLFPL